MKRSPLNRKTPLAKQSRKRKAENTQYLYKRAILLPGKFCEFPSSIPCVNQASEVHHIKGRRGKMLLDTTHWLFVCREHHRFIHDHGKDARKLGLIQP